MNFFSDVNPPTIPKDFPTLLLDAYHMSENLIELTCLHVQVQRIDVDSSQHRSPCPARLWASNSKRLCPLLDEAQTPIWGNGGTYKQDNFGVSIPLSSDKKVDRTSGSGYDTYRVDPTE